MLRSSPVPEQDCIILLTVAARYTNEESFSFAGPR